LHFHVDRLSCLYEQVERLPHGRRTGIAKFMGAGVYRVTKEFPGGESAEPACHSANLMNRGEVSWKRRVCRAIEPQHYILRGRIDLRHRSGYEERNGGHKGKQTLHRPDSFSIHVVSHVFLTPSDFCQ
jgi:hypothetical protein